MVGMASTKAQREHEKALARQRARARRVSPQQLDRNRIGINLCRAILNSYEQHRESKQATGST